MESETLSRFSPAFSGCIETLIRDGRIGICAGNLRLIETNSSLPSISKEPKCDRFKLAIPYACQTLIWEVLFDSQYPKEPPDVIFAADDEDFCPELTQLKTLKDWDCSRSDSLLLLLQELIESYSQHQYRVIQQYPRIQFEYSSLLQAGFTIDDIEILVNRTSNKVGPIHFLIKLTVDFSSLPAYLTQENPGEDSGMLLITFQTIDATRVQPQLFLSPRVQHALGDAANLRIPAFLTTSSLVQYVPNVLELLQNKVKQVEWSYLKRQEYIAAFLSHFGRSVVEYDAEAFYRISLLYEWNDFFFVLHVELNSHFPQEQPSFILQSVYHEANGQPFHRIIKDYPYSPRWSANQMAERARSYLLDNISSFQKSSVLSGSFR